MPRQNDGGILQGCFGKVEMVIGEEGFSHKCSRITGIKIDNPFTKYLSDLTIHVQVDNKVALAYLLKMGGFRNPQLLKTAKSI